MFLPHTAVALVLKDTVRISWSYGSQFFGSSRPVLISDDQFGHELGVVKDLTLKHLLQVSVVCVCHVTFDGFPLPKVGRPFTQFTRVHAQWWMTGGRRVEPLALLPFAAVDLIKCAQHGLDQLRYVDIGMDQRT